MMEEKLIEALKCIDLISASPLLFTQQIKKLSDFPNQRSYFIVNDDKTGRNYSNVDMFK